MSLRWYSVVIDSADIAAQARWWADVLGWSVDNESKHEVWIAPPGDAEEVADSASWDRQRPVLCFLSVTLLWILNTDRVPREWSNKASSNVLMVLCALAFFALAVNEIVKAVRAV